MRDNKNKWDPMSPSEAKSHDSILDKLATLERDPRLRFMMCDFRSEDPDLPQILQQFVGELPAAPKADIRIIDISGLPNEVAGPLTAAIARLLFQYKVWQSRLEREKDPVLLVCEEAHRYVPDTGLAEYASAQKAIRRLAKEGRKYGVGMILVSQRPADVEGTVLSQCNSWLVLRLTNTTDQQHVAKFLPDSLAGLAKMLPSLARQEAIFVGDAAALPARIKIRTLRDDELPQSDDVSFGNGWQTAPMSLSGIKSTVDRWRRDVPLVSEAIATATEVDDDKSRKKKPKS
jgi:DNA helicase HerA-like ATPase